MMMQHRADWRGVVRLIAVGLAAACARPAEPTRSGGDTTVQDSSGHAYMLPAHNLREEHRAAFFVGNSFFNKNWIAAPASVTDRDGLGPLFNARSCSACHARDGRGRPPDPGGGLVSMVLRVGPDPMYGDQIQTQALPGIAPEAEVTVTFEEQAGRYPDGEPFFLRRPRYALRAPGYGPPPPALRTSGRVAPPLPGLGLLEAVPEAALRALEDPDDRDGDGVSGRLALVGDRAPGRFGWKAEQPTVLAQVAAAFQADLGLTTRLLPAENHTAGQTPCQDQPSGGTPEVSDAILRAVALYARTLAVPARRLAQDDDVRTGARLFREAGCATCHRPELRTGAYPELPELAHQTIHPYTDLLLHDLGPGLSDDRPVAFASGGEWRTPPLWGLGLSRTVNGHTFLLHDGRARDPAEAILWHGGEAAAAQRAFLQLPRAQRRALLAFLESL
jgi:CxxC motif-containing protein (DUF1111 family)